MGGDDQRLIRRGSFDEDPDNYQAARPGYPRRVYEVLADYGLRPGARVLEIGPGTGQVTRPSWPPARRCWRWNSGAAWRPGCERTWPTAT
ncbi:hypothetical protein [Micromonospora sp. NPDC049102]|uniref:hypothetical protein n=1 Tax=Micromonospora sp. NPDC049102 TaxID=3364265 RepID=UPI003715C61E